MSVGATNPRALASAPDELIRSIARTRDPAAFTQLFSAFRPKLTSYFLRLGVDEPAAEELTQDTLLTVWRKAEQFDPARASAGGWIFAIARNLRIDRLRRQRFQLWDADPADEPWSDPPERETQLRAALGALRPADAEVLSLSFVEGWTHGQIAGRLHLPLGTVKSRIRRAAARLRKRVQAKGPPVGRS